MAMAMALAGGARPTALLCLNHRIAFGAYQALHEADLRMPRTSRSSHSTTRTARRGLLPALISIAPPHVELGPRE